MSNPLKKIKKKVKKVFKKAVDTVKKIANSKLFKIAVIAAAVYFTAGAAAGYMGAAGAPGWASSFATLPGGAASGAAAAGSAAGTAAAGTAAAAPVVSAVPAAAAGGTAAGAAAAPISSATVSLAPKAAMTLGEKLTLAATAAQAGGPAISQYAKAREEERIQREQEKNSKYRLDLDGIYGDQLRAAGAVGADEGGRTVYDEKPRIAQLSNVEASDAPNYYNSATDSWSPVHKASKKGGKA